MEMKMGNGKIEKVVTITQAADMVGRKRGTIYFLAKSGKIDYVQDESNNNIFVSVKSLKKFYSTNPKSGRPSSKKGINLLTT